MALQISSSKPSHFRINVFLRLSPERFHTHLHSNFICTLPYSLIRAAMPASQSHSTGHPPIRSGFTAACRSSAPSGAVNQRIFEFGKPFPSFASSTSRRRKSENRFSSHATALLPGLGGTRKSLHALCIGENVGKCTDGDFITTESHRFLSWGSIKNKNQ